jgi:hypothetical protein
MTLDPLWVESPQCRFAAGREPASLKAYDAYPETAAPLHSLYAEVTLPPLENYLKEKLDNSSDRCSNSTVDSVQYTVVKRPTLSIPR